MDPELELLMLKAKAGASSQQASPSQAAPATEDPNYFQRVAQDWKDNAAAGQASDAAVSSGEISPLHYGFQTLGQGVIGNIAAPINEGIKSAVGMIPQGVKDVMVNPAVQDAFSGIGNHVQAYLADKPNLARDLQSLSNVAAVVPAVEPMANVARGAADYTASGIGNVAKGVTARTGDALDAATEKMYQNYSDNYQKMRDIGAHMNGESANTLANSVNGAVKDTDIVPELYPKTAAVIQRINEKAADGSLSLNHLDQYRRMLNKASASEDSYTAGAVRNAIDTHVNGLTGSDLTNGSTDAVAALNDARKSYQQASKFEDVANIVKSANGDANKIKAKMTTFMNNKNNTLGWTEDEIQAGKEAANLSPVEGVSKLLGKFGFDFGGGGNVGSGFAALVGGASMAGAAGTGAGVAVPVVGTIARQGQKWLARGKAENLLQTLQAPSLSSKITP